jgi:hypothetical protein
MHSVNHDGEGVSPVSGGSFLDLGNWAIKIKSAATGEISAS